MADKIIEELTRRVEELEKKYYEVNFPYQKPPYPCVVENVAVYRGDAWARAFLLSDGQIKFADGDAYGRSSGSFETAPTTLGVMAERAGVEVPPSDMKKKTVVASKIFEKFGGMKWAYMGEFMVSDNGNLFSISSESPAERLDAIEKRTAELGLPFKIDSSASVWDNVKAAFHALKIADESKNKS